MPQSLPVGRFRFRLPQYPLQKSTNDSKILWRESTVNGLSVDFYWISFVRSSVLPLAKNHPIRKLMDEELNGELQGYAQIGKTGDVEPSVENFEYGFRASAYWKYADISLYGFSGILLSFQRRESNIRSKKTFFFNFFHRKLPKTCF